jgi:DNA-binding NarL/FixJ family response regulator
VISPDQQPIRVVLADDTRDIRLLLALALELAGGFEVVGEAADGNEAIAQVTVHQPDILLLDLAMPVLDGLQALPHIRERAPDSVVVVLSGFGASAMGEEAVRLGATTYVQKGVNPTELAEQLRALMRDRTAAEGGS